MRRCLDCTTRSLSGPVATVAELVIVVAAVRCRECLVLAVGVDVIEFGLWCEFYG